MISSTTSQFKPRQPKKVTHSTDDDSMHALKTAKLFDLVFNIVRDERTSELFVGGRNNLYKLDPDSLEIMQNTTTGPADHHPECKPSPETCHRNRSRIDNDNKVLIVYMEKKHYSKVLSCGTTHQGMCFLHMKNNLDSKAFLGSPAVVNNFLVSSASVVSFLANVEYENDSVIFVGNQYDGRKLSLSPPLISSKKIVVKPVVGFEHTHENSTHRSFIDIDPMRKPGHPVTFVFGFTNGTFAYFITTSPVAYGSPDHETRVSRVCLNDRSFKSFSEIPIICENSDMTFNIATSAFLGSSATSIEKDVLYVSFMHAPSRRGPVVDQSKGSVICSFSMSQIAEKFYEAAKECSIGSDQAKVSTLFVGSPISSKCLVDSVFNEQSLCHPTRNFYIEGNSAIEAVPIIRLPGDKVTSLTTLTSQSGSPAAAVIAMVGTSSGDILKVQLSDKGSLKLNDAQRILYRTRVDKSAPFPKKSDDVQVRPSTTFDANMDNLFILSGRSVLKFPVKSCRIYKTCRSCLSTLDPLDCGWCDGKCGHAKECPGNSPPDRTTCTPVIYDFYPKKGPYRGGTAVTVHGDNFGSLSAGEQNVKTYVRFGEAGCEIISWEMEKIVCRTKKSTNSMEVKVRVEVADTSKISAKFDIIGSVTSSVNFEFVDPIINGITPKFGPQSGGTNMTIMGQNLDSGATRIILIGSSSCDEKSNNGINITCITSGTRRKSDGGIQRVQIHFDGHSVYSPDNFTYKADAVISRIHPMATIASGGVPIYVEGECLDSLPNPRMEIQVHDSPPKIAPCSVINSTVMFCVSPKVWDQLRPEPGREPLSTEASFSMDGKVISEKFELKYYPDPVIYTYDEPQSVYLQDPVIEIIGTNLRPDFEMSIFAGSDSIPCPILPSSTVGNIKCQLMLENTPNVGDSLIVSYTLGQMSGELGPITFVRKPGMSVKTFVAVTVVFVVLLILVAILLFCLKKQGLIMKKKHPSFTVEYRPEGPLENGKDKFYLFPLTKNRFTQLTLLSLNHTLYFRSYA